MSETIFLLPHAEKLAPNNPFASSTPMLLYHQWRTYQALRDYPLVVNTYNTGTGKTRAALLHLMDAVPHGVNTLLIAPTNELIRQHVGDVRSFAERAKLDVHVLHVDASTLRGLTSSRESERSGERLNRLFQNPRDYGWDGRKPIVAVTNPDIFYYALYYAAYNPHDARNLFQQFLTRFDYVIVDEFHCYTAKQLANFLFFFAICRDWGYFSTGRRVCLLSATPEPTVRDYLDRLFAPGEMVWVSPDSEPPESAAYPTTPVLASVTLEVQVVTVDEFTGSTVNRAQLASWLDIGREGALISNALWRINQAWAALRGPNFNGRMGRITGAETGGSRRMASSLPLILATPTVDLGYNFDRPDKTRQPLDFVIFDAHSRDAFLQRLGRAGRVLGRAQTDVPSTAVALVDEDAHTKLLALAGQTLSRTQFAKEVNAALPPRNDLYAYLRSYAVLEAFWPIFQLERQMPQDMHVQIEGLFDTVRQTFAPDSRKWYFGTLKGTMRRFEKLGKIVRAKEHDSLGDFVGEYVDWLRPALDNADGADELVRQLHSNKNAQMRLLLPWAESQYWQTEALFNFREAFQSPTACVYDPRHLLAESDLTLYDALHVATNFVADYFTDENAFAQAVGIPAEPADVYCHLRDHRSPRLRIMLAYRPERFARDQFEPLYCRRPVTIKGIKLRADVPGSGPSALDPALHHALEDKYVPMLIVKNQDEGRLMNLLRDRDIFTRILRVAFADGTENDYRVLVGTSAFIIHAELEGYLWWRERTEDRAPIIT